MPTPLSFFNTFADIVAEHTLAYTRYFQPGNDRVLPPTPEEFAASLAKEAKGFGVDFPGGGDAAAIMQDAINAYQGTYRQILRLKLPENPTDGYAAWYRATHPQ